MAFEKSEEQQHHTESVSWSIGNCSMSALLGYTVSYLLFITGGGFCFMLMEGDAEDNLKERLEFAKITIMRKFHNVSMEALDQFVSELSNLGFNGLPVQNVTEDKWSYSNSIFFCVTLLTTIGYGHVAPATQVGKAFCILYSGFGLPFTVILLASWVERLMGGCRRLRSSICICANGSFRDLTVKLMFIISLAVIISVIFFFVPAFVLLYFEKDWTYLDSLYFCFISLTTIGLGDFVPAKSGSIQHVDSYRIVVAVYLFVGITAITLLMALCAEFRGYIQCHQLEGRPVNQPSTEQPCYGTVNEKTRLLYENGVSNC